MVDQSFVLLVMMNSTVRISTTLEQGYVLMQVPKLNVIHMFMLDTLALIVMVIVTISILLRLLQLQRLISLFSDLIVPMKIVHHFSLRKIVQLLPHNAPQWEEFHFVFQERMSLSVTVLHGQVPGVVLTPL
jgi:hypothetical protein